ncbi:MAG: metallophosphoesterase [Candidatus Berkelbacteria bacterium]|nr:metallophosphoesterase [Candidatus Berkelbacteria bacterium]
MKIALISDLHSQPKTLLYLQQIIDLEKPNAIICAGDITQGDNLDFLDNLFEVFKKSKIEAFLVWGNAEGVLSQRKILESSYNSHLCLRSSRGEKIFGIADVSDYPIFDTSLLKDAILITHRPPLVSSLNKKMANSPKFHISGHLHKPGFVKKYKATTHIQVPTLQDKRYAILDSANSSVLFCKVPMLVANRF